MHAFKKKGQHCDRWEWRPLWKPSRETTRQHSQEGNPALLSVIIQPAESYNSCRRTWQPRQWLLTQVRHINGMYWDFKNTCVQLSQNVCVNHLLSVTNIFATSSCVQIYNILCIAFFPLSYHSLQGPASLLLPWYRCWYNTPPTWVTNRELSSHNPTYGYNTYLHYSHWKKHIASSCIF